MLYFHISDILRYVKAHLHSFITVSQFFHNTVTLHISVHVLSVLVSIFIKILYSHSSSHMCVLACAVQNMCNIYMFLLNVFTSCVGSNQYDVSYHVIHVYQLLSLQPYLKSHTSCHVVQLYTQNLTALTYLLTAYCTCQSIWYLHALVILIL